MQLETVRWFTQADGYRRIISAYTLGNETKLRYIHTHGMRTEVYAENESSEAGLVELLWESTVLEPLLAELAESESAQAGLVTIAWEEVVSYDISTSHSESEAAQAGLTAISWVEIFKVSDSFEESESAQAGLVSILWVKP